VLQVSRAAPAPAASTVSQQGAFSTLPSLDVFTQGSSRLSNMIPNADSLQSALLLTLPSDLLQRSESTENGL